MPHVMVVVSPYYEEVSNHLLKGAKAVLEENHCTFEVYEATGALEIPLALQYGVLRQEGRGTDKLKFDAYVALGCVIRGETSHYDIVCEQSAQGLMRVSLDHNVPVGNGILTCGTMEQAIIRADTAQKNKGADAANAVLSLLNLSIKVRR